jgi:hemerythrin-like domain-containing protein
MTPVETLQSEHRAIGVALDILEAICRRIERTQTVDNADHIDALIDFFTNFADKIHHGKEEVLLYPFLEENRTRVDDHRTWRMLKEHELGRDFLRGLHRAMERVRENNPEGPDMLVYMAMGYIEAMRRHIRNETAIFLDMADSRLPEADLERLANGFETIDKHWFGPDLCAVYRTLPTRLGRLYIH